MKSTRLDSSWMFLCVAVTMVGCSPAQNPGLPTESGQVEALAFSPDGEWLAIGGGGNQDHPYNITRIWDSTFSRDIARLPQHGCIVRTVQFSPDGKLLATGGDDSHLCLWRTSDFAPIHESQEEIGWIRAMAFRSNGSLLATTGHTTIDLWDMPDAKRIAGLRGHTHAITTLAFAPDRSLLASGSDFGDLTIRLWDVDKQAQLKVLKGHEDKVTGLAFLSDGKRLVSSSKDGSFWLWDTDQGTVLKSLLSIDRWVQCCAVSKDGGLVAAGDAYGTVHIWNTTADWKHTTMPQKRPGTVMSLAFSPDGKRLVSGGHDNMLHVWDLATDKFQAIDLRFKPGVTVPVVQGSTTAPVTQGTKVSDSDK